MDLGALDEYLVPIIVLAGLIIGYVIKATPALQGARPYIPLVLTLIGGALGLVINGITVEALVLGMASGLAATGANQAFRKVVPGKDVETDEENEDEQGYY
ncbi:MAG: phage holin family protein [Atopostipes suicloacalis]|nr:phage holin family protein [Atopostipes suicloacalis]